MKDNRLISLGEILDRSLPPQVRRRLVTPEVAKAWRAAVGDAVAAKAKPVGFDRAGRLIVAVSGAIWRNELKFMEPEVRAQMAQAGLKTEGLRFTEPIAPPPERQVRPKASAPVDPALAASLAEGIKVSDPRLRTALLALALSMAMDQPPEEER